MHRRCFEPSLEEILSDPIVISLMEADGVDREKLVTMLRGIAAKNRARSRQARARERHFSHFAHTTIGSRRT